MSLFKAINKGLGQMLSHPDPVGDTLGRFVAVGFAVMVVVMVVGLLR